MFQYAIGKAVAHSSGADLIMDDSLLRRELLGVTSRDIEIDAYRIWAPIRRRATSPNLLSDRLMRSQHPAARRLLRLGGRVLEGPASDGFDSRNLDSKSGCIMRGYFQSYRYFMKVEEQLLAEFVLKEPSPWFLDQVAVIDSPHSVAVHVRRGDYLAGSGHGRLPDEYYRQALDLLRREMEVGSIYVFSDEPDAIQAGWLERNSQIRVISPPPGVRPAESLMAMTRARALIAANSSFSWWAAWIASKSCGSRVVIPSPWSIDRTLTNPDMSPPDWLRASHGW